MVTEKIYKIIKNEKHKQRKGVDLFNAIFNEENGSYNPPELDDWIEEQAKSYLEKEWDAERMKILIWDMEDQQLINFLTRIEVDLDYLDIDYVWVDKKHKALPGIKKKEYIVNRDIFPVWMKLADTVEKDILEQFKKIFFDDLENKRDEWAYERANRDFDIFINDINKDDDQNVAEFFGLTFEIVGYVIGGEHFDITETECCTYCEEPMILGIMKDECYEENGQKLRDDEFFCNTCGTIYKYNEKHIELNKHNKDKIILRCV